MHNIAEAILRKESKQVRNLITSLKARIPVAANKEMTPDQHLRRFELREAS